MSIYPNWLEVDLGSPGGVVFIDSFEVAIEEDIYVEMQSGITVEILDDTITVEIC